MVLSLLELAETKEFREGLNDIQEKFKYIYDGNHYTLSTKDRSKSKKENFDPMKSSIYAREGDIVQNLEDYMNGYDFYCSLYTMYVCLNVGRKYKLGLLFGTGYSFKEKMKENKKLFTLLKKEMAEDDAVINLLHSIWSNWPKKDLKKWLLTLKISPSPQKRSPVAVLKKKILLKQKISKSPVGKRLSKTKTKSPVGKRLLKTKKDL